MKSPRVLRDAPRIGSATASISGATGAWRSIVVHAPYAIAVAAIALGMSLALGAPPGGSAPTSSPAANVAPDGASNDAPDIGRPPSFEYADRPGQLAYTDAGVLVLANADGSSPRRFGGVPSAGLHGVAWSPDGRHLLSRGSGDSRDGMFHVADGAGVPMFSRDGCCATWSPDGTRVAALIFDWSRGGADRERGATFILVVGLDGSTMREIRLPGGRPGNLVQVFWFPDGRSLLVDDLYLEQSGSRGDTWSISLDSGAARPYPVKPLYGARSFFSPDGSRVVGSEAETLVVAAADGSGDRFVSDQLADRADWYASAWSPDSRSIALLLGRGDASPLLRIVDAGGRGTPVPVLTNEIGRDLRIGYVMDWSPNDGRILFSGEDGLWATDPDGSDLELLVAGVQYGRWQPVLESRP